MTKKERKILEDAGLIYPTIVTIADRIRAMSDEELADLLTAVAKKSAEMLCKSLKTVEVDLSECDFEILTKTHLSWLKSPVEVDNGAVH